MSPLGNYLRAELFHDTKLYAYMVNQSSLDPASTEN